MINLDDVDFDEASLPLVEAYNYEFDTHENMDKYCAYSMDPEVREAIAALDKRKKELSR